MIKRCTDKTYANYHRYGGRGITICERWNDYRNFLEDMGVKPTGTTLERTDNDGNYELYNCRWATPYEQATNRSNNHLITCNGITYTITDWARVLDISESTIRRRLDAGVSIEDALSTEKWIQRLKKKEPNTISSKANLTIEQVREIKQKLRMGIMSKTLAEEYNVTKYVIYNVKTGRQYKHVLV